MKIMQRILGIFFIVGCLYAGDDFYGTVPIKDFGPTKLARLETDPGLSWWVEMGDSLLIAAQAREMERIKKEWNATSLPTKAKGRPLAFALLGEEALPKGSDILARSGRLAVVFIENATDLKDKSDEDCRHGHTQIKPFAANTVLQRSGSNYDLPAHRADAQIQELVDLIDIDRWFADVTHLASYNRYTHGPEVLTARDWLVDQFEALPNLTVTTQSFLVGSTTAYNVIATLTGTSRPEDIYIVGAHYDSRSESSSSSLLAAPGAEDNGSGTAAVLEMARIFSAHPTEGTVIFICYSGEEQGLYGSEAHATGLTNAGQASQMKAALIMDMIAYAVNPNNLVVLLETGNLGSFLFNPMIAAVQDYTSITTTTSLNPFGSDHIPYLQRNMPALLTIENDYDSYPGYHRTTDTPDKLIIPMGLGIIQLNVATLASLAGQASVSEGDFFVYVEAWNQPVVAPRLRDYNKNGLVDITDLIDRLNRP